MLLRKAYVSVSSKTIILSTSCVLMTTSMIPLLTSCPCLAQLHLSNCQFTIVTQLRLYHEVYIFSSYSSISSRYSGFSLHPLQHAICLIPSSEGLSSEVKVNHEMTAFSYVNIALISISRILAESSRRQTRCHIIRTRYQKRWIVGCWS
ncbi:hypothetical protein K435DRAFT_126618 [Dendrothele bispora CBS 962.96]|uniref:Uncharacterized protein n=1 Tax=Dendrothele bispora (strain CBS 962.96) TaxID=1314807 RepID=A0A4V4HFM5_DENBC|nr:hypothetical protein K435DRAFT_126618 [Dendrothele bispora CBS 962.96]